MSHKKKSLYPWLCNPNEFFFSAYSGSGKTILIEKLVAEFSKEHIVGYLKSDAHHFEMDREGKDTQRMSAAGAQHVQISGQTSRAVLEHQAADALWHSALVEADLVFIEGYKEFVGQNRFLLLDEAGKMLSEMATRDLDGVQAVIGPEIARPKEIPSELKYFQRDELKEIIDFINTMLLESRPPLRGVVLIGGFSTRMGQDKASLDYHGKSMAVHTATLLAEVCDEVFISCRPNQEVPADCADFPRLEDRFIGFGPFGGILSAFCQDPHAGWFVSACDLPFITSEAVQILAAKRNHLRYASAFRAHDNGLPEPLFSIYEPKSRLRCLQYVALGRYSPRKMLLSSPVEMLTQEQDCLQNANHPKEFASFKDLIGDQ